MIGIQILLAHLAGDYLLQNDYLANEKTKRWAPAIIHGLLYTAAYAFVTQSWEALAVIGLTHIVIDRFRLAKHFIWAVNQVGPGTRRYSWAEAQDNCGYASGKPMWMTFWLMIIVDNSIHLLINTAAIAWLAH